MNNRTTAWVLRSGTNKGQRRIWIEGPRLTELGLVRGTRFARSIEHGAMSLSIIAGEPPTGPKHTIAGTVDRPILDLCGKWVTKFMGTADRFVVVPMVDESGNVQGLRVAPVKP